MRILNVEGLYFVEHFKKLGHEVLSIGHAPGCDVVLREPMAARMLFETLQARGFWPDLAVWADACKPPAVLGLELLPCVTIGYSIDQYCNPWHVPWSACFDVILLAQKDYVPMFRLPQLIRPAQWMPLFFRPDPSAEQDVERDIPVSFVGTMTGSINHERKGFLDRFRMLCPLVAVSGNYRPIYGRSRVVLNQSAVGEINFRVFEGAGCGAAVVTEQVGQGLDELFVVGEEIATYARGDAVDAARVCRELLDDFQAGERMAQAGRRRVLRDHGAAKRAKDIVRLARDMAAQEPWRWRRDHAQTVRQELGKMCVFLGMDRELPLPWEMAQGYLRMGVARLARG